MGRLIDADAIERCLVIGGRRHGKKIISEIIYRAIQAAPTVDAVPVIRCKDCSWHYGTICRRNSTFPWEDDDYCSKAEVEE